ncbi:PREDICTED: probable ATP-dependent RNA helicase DDX60 isoform X1 [Branchiostoma belcheri]|uniref:Probable ATP-dependent RNA helicase DDX60 isoform X1 n=1 Tax=Branchiostoma belcheri TaxID=7741 RepID=A0A6P5AL10_BRABE|nr:PREDICTED: probable ATP-dependent RNA helicase DDX60 isoform X1 [Branchiostoma belcheri]
MAGRSREIPDSWEQLDEELEDVPDEESATDMPEESWDTSDDDSYEDPEEEARPSTPTRTLSSDDSNSDSADSESESESDHEMENEDEGEISSIAKICLKHLPADNHIKSQWVSLLHDFVDSELFIIDGDSLLLELLSEVNLDWSHGGQYLHLIFLVERFLHTFHQLGGIFHIVFFRDMQVLWTSCPSMMLARHVIIQHLQENTAYTVTTNIPAADSPQWHQYLQNNRPAFVTISDGCQNLPLGLPKNAVLAVFKTLLLHVLSEGVNCVYMSEIEHTATKAYGFYIECRPHIMNMWSKKYLEYREKGQYPSMLSLLQQNVTEDCKNLEQLRSKLMKVSSSSLARSLPAGVRDVVTVVACSQVLDQRLTTADAQVTEDIVRFFLLHIVLLRHLSLRQRAQQLRDFSKAPFSFPVHLLSRVMEQVQVCMVEMLEECSRVGYFGEMETKFLSDIMDGRLFLQLSYFILDAHSRGQQASLLSEDVRCELEVLWDIVTDISESELSPAFPVVASPVGRIEREDHSAEQKEHTANSVSDELEALGIHSRAAFFPVSNKLVDAFAGNVNNCLPHLDRTDREVTAAITENQDFDETYHWHSGKPLADDYDNTKDTFNHEQLPTDPWLRRKVLKDKQKFSRHMQSYGESLEGPGFRKVPIVVREKSDQKQEEKERKKKERQEMAKTAKQKTVKKSKKDLIIEAAKKKEEETKATQMLQQWQTLKTSLESSKAVKSIRELETFVEKCSREQVPHVATEAQLTILQHKVDMWRDQCTKGDSAGDIGKPNLNTAVDIVQTVSDIVDKYGQHLRSKQRQELAGALRLLGLSDMEGYIVISEGSEQDMVPDGLKVHTKSKDEDTRCSVQMSSNRFQLRHMGHLLKREGREDADPRVQQFIPDTWQRELLDAVDNNESALIVAPTSSGKTYASYYCMEKVLRDGDDGVVVYVSPTKALVNQVAATVYARFSNKKMPDGMSVYGVFTRDYRHNALNSQILVTVPQCLEILLLAPHRQKWAQKIRYVIFDEVHCMGSEIGAEVWEHLLLLVPCPFLALSATISNPQDLQGWLQSAKDFQKQLDGQAKQRKKAHPQSYNVRLVVYGERYSDLEKSVYLPCSNSEDSLVPMHPYSVLTVKQLQDNLDNPDGAFPRDLTLSPRETLQLYDTMAQVWPERESLKALEADTYSDFATRDHLLITKAQARQYEADLKKELLTWLKEHHKEKVRHVLEKLSRHMLQQQDTCAKEQQKHNIDITGEKFLSHQIVRLLDKLKQEDKLPALVFSFSRGLIEHLVHKVDVTLEEMEMETLESMGVTQSSIKKDLAMMRKVEKGKKRVRDKEEKGYTLEAKDVPDAKHVNQDGANMRLAFLKHSFVSEGLHSSEELQRYQRRINYLSGGHLLKRGLRRGIGYHHAGMNAKERQTVETMFRNKHLKVVVATATLALGIHMPCKTVVFAGDSVYLDALEYRQMSGRAGRRGFDSVGNVVFFGLPKPKINRLLAANVPELTGNYPLTPSLVLRVMLLTAQGDDKTDAFNKALNLLKHPFLSHNQPQFLAQLQHHFLFSIQFLMRQGLLDLEGTPQGMAGLASHLHYHEPSNFILVWLLQKGIFHQICVPEDGSTSHFSDDVLRRLVLILANLFGRSYLRATITPQTVKDMKQRKELSQSKLILEDLPEFVSSSIRQYNQQTWKLFHSYLCTVAEALAPQLGQETSLPASQIDFLSAGTGAPSADSQTLTAQLRQSQIHFSVVSTFAALSGLNDDNFQESDNMFESVRQGLYMDMDSAPTFLLEKHDRRGRRQYLNSYALDFFKHQSYDAIIKDNGLRTGFAFQALKDFMMTIKSIYIALEQLGHEEDNVVMAFKQLAGRYDEAFNNAFGKNRT